MDKKSPVPAGANGASKLTDSEIQVALLASPAKCSRPGERRDAQSPCRDMIGNISSIVTPQFGGHE